MCLPIYAFISIYNRWHLVHLDTSSLHTALKQSFGKLKAKRVKLKKQKCRVAQSANFFYSRILEPIFTLLLFVIKATHSFRKMLLSSFSFFLFLFFFHSNARSLEDYYVIINCRECILLWLCIYFEWKKKKKKMMMNIAHTQWNLYIYIRWNRFCTHTNKYIGKD